MEIANWLVGALGLGSLITVIAQALLNQKSEQSKRRFQEKKEAYISLLQAYHQAAVEGTDAATKEFAYWQMRCELVAPVDVRDTIQEIINTNNGRNCQNHDAAKNSRQTINFSFVGFRRFKHPIHNQF